MLISNQGMRVFMPNLHKKILDGLYWKVLSWLLRAWVSQDFFVVFVWIEDILRQACRPRGCRGMSWLPQILAVNLTLSQPGGTDYAHHNTTGTPGYSHLPTAL